MPEKRTRRPSCRAPSPGSPRAAGVAHHAGNKNARPAARAFLVCSEEELELERNRLDPPSPRWIRVQALAANPACTVLCQGWSVWPAPEGRNGPGSSSSMAAGGAEHGASVLVVGEIGVVELPLWVSPRTTSKTCWLVAQCIASSPRKSRRHGVGDKRMSPAGSGDQDRVKHGGIASAGRDCARHRCDGRPSTRWANGH